MNVVAAIVICSVLVGVLSQQPKHPVFVDGSYYFFDAVVPHQVSGYLVFNFHGTEQENTGFVYSIQDMSMENYPGAYKLRTKQFYTLKKVMTEVWFDNNAVSCGGGIPIKPFEEEPCAKGKFAGTKMLEQISGSTAVFVNVWKNCNFDGYLINFFPHEGIGANYTFYTGIFDEDRVYRIYAGDPDVTKDVSFIDLYDHSILNKAKLDDKFHVPSICTK